MMSHQTNASIEDAGVCKFFENVDLFTAEFSEISSSSSNVLVLPAKSKITIAHLNNDESLSSSIDSLFKKNGYLSSTIALPELLNKSVRKSYVKANALIFDLIGAELGLGDANDFLKLIEPLHEACREFLQDTHSSNDSAINQKTRSSAAIEQKLLVFLVSIDGQWGESHVQSISKCFLSSLLGYSATLRHEFPLLQVKAIDVTGAGASKMRSSDAIGRLFFRHLFLRGPCELGFDGVSWKSRQKVKMPSNDFKAFSDLYCRKDNPNDMKRATLVVGGAKGITYECLKRIPKGQVVHILGRSEILEENPSLQSFNSLVELRKGIVQQGVLANGDLKSVDKLARQIISSRILRHNLRELEKLGFKVSYHKVDILDKKQCTDIVSKINDLNPIENLVFGAGVIRDKLLLNKDFVDFKDVYATKVSGIINVIKAIDESQLKHVFLFSSSTSLFGRKGQLDYCCANLFINAFSGFLRQRNPSILTSVIGWGPWYQDTDLGSNSQGMVDKSLMEVFKSEGIGFIDYETGAFLFREAFEHGLQKPVFAVGKLDRVKVSSSDKKEAEKVQKSHLTYFSQTTAAILESHVISGKYVVPLAMQLELGIQEFLRSRSEYKAREVSSIENFRILSGIRFGEGETIACSSEISTIRDNVHEIMYSSEQENQTRSKVPRCRFDVKLHSQNPVDDKIWRVLENRAPYKYNFDKNMIYPKYLFHGYLMQFISHCRLDSHRFFCKIHHPVDPQRWHLNLGAEFVFNPNIIDAALQMVIVWSKQFLGMGCLPMGFDKLVVHRPENIGNANEIYGRVRELRGDVIVSDIVITSGNRVPVMSIIGQHSVKDRSFSTLTFNGFNQQLN